jgi:hypothetical protein
MTLVLVAVLVAVGVYYRRQAWRRVTRLRGGPSTTTPWAPLDGSGTGDPPALHLAVVGDVGHQGRRVDAVGAAVARIDRAQPLDGLVVLGDNVYPSGNPAGLDATVFRPFAAVLDHVPLYAILGNHDVKRNRAQAQVRALGMPGRWWVHHLPGDVLLVGLDSTLVDDPAQHAWLEAVLASATERWRLVAVHHPAYSAGYQGSSLAVRRRWSPLFARHGVALVLSGHDHDYQRSVPIDGVTYVVSGGGSRPRRTARESFTAVALGWLHAVEVAVYADQLVVRAVGRDLGVGDEAAVRSVTPDPRTGR